MTALIIFCGSAILSPKLSVAGERYSCENEGALIFGILPFVSTEQLVVRFAPLANYLSSKLHVPVRIETAPNFVEFARRTHEDQRYDILFTAPHFYPQANNKAGYRLIAAVDSPGMWAVIVAPIQSDIHTIKDLVGKRLATVHPVGLATLLVRKHLSDAGINPDVDVTMISTPSHDASLLSSYHGVTDASALMSPPFESANPVVRGNMRVIAKTQSTPHIPISLSRRVGETCGAKIKDLLLTIGDTAEGRNVLRHNRFSGFKETTPEVYEHVSDLLRR